MNEKSNEKEKDKVIDKEIDKKNNVPEINKATLGGSATEAWADAKCVDKETNMNYPSHEAVKNAKEWVEENEK